MKRLLLPLVIALVIPTSVNSSSCKSVSAERECKSNSYFYNVSERDSDGKLINGYCVPKGCAQQCNIREIINNRIGNLSQVQDSCLKSCMKCKR